MSGTAGRSGRRAKPAALKIAEGNRGHRRITADMLTHGAPVLPAYFNEAEIFLWHTTINALPAALLTAADSSCLERFVTGWAMFREASRQIARSGLMVRGSDGTPIRNPLLPVLRQASQMMHAAGGDLGLSPAARARLANPAGDGDDTMRWLLGGDPDLLN